MFSLCCLFIFTLQSLATVGLNWMDREWSCGLENVTKASMKVKVNSKWVKVQFLVNYPFGMQLNH